MSSADEYKYYMDAVETKKQKLRNAKSYGNIANAKDICLEILENLREAAKAAPERTADILEQIKIYETELNNLDNPPKVSNSSNNAGAPSSAQGGGGSDSRADDKKETDRKFSAPDNSEMMQFFDFYEPKTLEGFDSVIGLDDAKQAVRKYVINPTIYADKYNYKFLDNKAILLEGPPGTGKTTFAKAVACEIKQPFALIRMSSLVNCFIGETAKNIDKAFSYLRDYAERNDCGITVFFDEFDEIAKSRSGDDKVAEAAVPALLRNLDGVRTNKSFLILANTNLKKDLDPAIQERFRRQIYIPLPDKGMREALFRSKLSEVEEHFLSMLDFDKASTESEGLSGRDITYICDDFKYQLGEAKAGLIEESTLPAEFIKQIANRKKEKDSARPQRALY